MYDTINTPFEKTFGVSFAIAQTSVPEINVQVKKSRAELKKRKEKSIQSLQKTHWAAVDRECL